MSVETLGEQSDLLRTALRPSDAVRIEIVTEMHHSSKFQVLCSKFSHTTTAAAVVSAIG